MAILKVARLGHPLLRQVANPVPRDEIGSPEIQRLIDDMVETMREYDGAGLAANQVHTLRQIAVIEVDRKSTRLNSSHTVISYAVFCLKKKKKKQLQEIHTPHTKHITLLAT